MAPWGIQRSSRSSLASGWLACGLDKGGVPAAVKSAYKSRFPFPIQLALPSSPLSSRNLRKSLEAVGQILSEPTYLRLGFHSDPLHLSSRNFNFNLIDGQSEGQLSPWALRGIYGFSPRR